MLRATELQARAEAAASDPLLRALAAGVRSRVERILREPPPLLGRKATLTQDGGVCPDDGAPLLFDPWQPHVHRCPRCNSVVTGERHDGHWARAGHLWIAERIADLATLAALEGDEAAAKTACGLLGATADIYGDLPNADNVLGPTHLFFSTYLESLWVTTWLAGAWLLRETERLDAETEAAVDAVAEEAATLIGEFNEGMSNRQTWNAAALVAIGTWFGDEELAQNAVEGRSGLLGHLTDGFQGAEAAWWEGENYHLFAQRGLTVGMAWANVSGFGLLDSPELAAHYRAALLAPSLTALPDLTFPARKDSRYGVSLAEPAYLETWEIGRSWLGADEGLDRWLAALYAAPTGRPDHYDAWLHDAGHSRPARHGRGDLSWWSLLLLDPRDLLESAPFVAPSIFLPSQGLAVLRREDRYVSLECRAAGGGHGHPDRLHLTLHAGGVHWLADPGAGSYVDRSLFWYRSARAHNAPTEDGESPGNGGCAAFDERDGWGWIRATAGHLTRTVVTGPDLVVDLVELAAPGPVAVELPWHLRGELRVMTPGTWETAILEDAALTAVEKFRAGAPGVVSVEAVSGERRVRLHLGGDAELFRAVGPGLPGSNATEQFLLRRTQAVSTWLGAVLELAPAEGTKVEWTEAGLVVQRGSEKYEIVVAPTRTTVSHPGGRVVLAGLQETRVPPAPLIAERPGWDARAFAPHAWSAPALDGTLEGFDTDHPLMLDTEHQYRRSEEPYDPERFTATAWVNWDPESLYLAVQVTKPELVLREADAAPLGLDNEPDDIHIDGLQFYLRWLDGASVGFVAVPDPSGAMRVRPVGQPGTTVMDGAWSALEAGYLVTLSLRDPRIASLRAGNLLGFDLVVNEMVPERVRRLGQLVWSGDGGWTYLRGDRGDPAGVLELG